MKRRMGAGAFARGAVTFLAYYLGAQLGFALTFQPHPVSTLWPPNAILLAALLLTPPAEWWVVLLAAFASHLTIELQEGVPVLMVLCWFISNCAEALIGAVCMTRFSRRPIRFDNFRDTGVFVVWAVLGAPFLSSFLDAGFVELVGRQESGYWQVWRIRFFSNLLATLTFVPVLVLLVSNLRSYLRALTIRRTVEALGLTLGVVATGILVFGGRGLLPSRIPVIVCAPLPLFLWAAVRFGPAGVSFSLLITALFAIWGSIHNRGPFTQLSPIDNAFSLQLFLIVVSVPLMFLASLLQERYRAEESLRSSHEQISSLAGRLIHAQEEERKKIARELHDDFTQRLAVQAMALSDAKQQLPPACGVLAGQLDALKDLTVALSEDLRLISHELHPATLEHAGLPAALRTLSAEFTKLTNTRVDLCLDCDKAKLPPDLALCCYRVAQEALGNVARHARATLVQISVHATDSRLFLSIADNGAGIDPAKLHVQSGLGITSMRERVKVLGGEFEILPRFRSGTLVTIALPLDGKNLPETLDDTDAAAVPVQQGSRRPEESGVTARPEGD